LIPTKKTVEVQQKQGHWNPLWVALNLVFLLAIPGLGQGVVVSAVPDADAFLRSLAATSNYGGGGALSVSGSAPVNGSNEQNGSFDSLMRFPTTSLVTSLDNAFGAQNWLITRARLLLNEMTMPDNEIFSRGVGSFEVRWIASNDWVEGTGKPSMPTSDGVAWQDLSGILNSNVDVCLGVFTNSGMDGQVALVLALADRFINETRVGNEIGLYLTAASPEIGFTFNSRQFGNTNARPTLEITAMRDPKPKIDNLVLVGTSASITFGTSSNWTYKLQYLDDFPSPLPGAWSDLWVVPGQSDSTVTYQDAVTNRQRFYRLLLSP